MTGSSWISGEETLGIQPDRNPNYPLRNKVSLPRTIIAQFDSIQCEIILKKWTPSVMKQLRKSLFSNKPSIWFTNYVVIFMLLHEISHSTKDRYRHAQQNMAPVNMCPFRARSPHFLCLPLYLWSPSRVVLIAPCSGQNRYGSLGHFVEQLQENANVLLAVWQYYKCADLANFDWENRSSSRLKYLTTEQAQFIQWSARMLAQRRTLSR